MSAKLDYKSLLVIAKEISKCSAEHALILSDLERVRSNIRIVLNWAKETGSVKGQPYSIYRLRLLRADLLSRERQLLEHRAALVDQLRW